jgi:hypothetical protein
MKSSDENLKRPEYVSYPARWDYDSEEEYDKAVKEYENSGYQNAIKQWNDKLDRDEIRLALDTGSLDFDYYTLCYYNGRYEKVLNENVVSTEKIAIAQDDPAIIFRIAEIDKLKKVKISKVKDVTELQNKLKEQINQLTVTMLSVESTTSAIGYNDVDYYYIAPDASAVYYMSDLVYDKGVGNLYEMIINSKKPRKPKVYEKDVVISIPTNYSGNVAYFKYGENNSTDLYVNKEKLGTNIINYEISNDQSSCIFMSDYKDSTYEAVLNVFKKGEIIKIDERVKTFTQSENGDILYKKPNDKSNETHDLYIYRNGKSEKIDSDVSHILSPYILNYSDISGDILVN